MLRPGPQLVLSTYLCNATLSSNCLMAADSYYSVIFFFLAPDMLPIKPFKRQSQIWHICNFKLTSRKPTMCILYLSNQ